MLTTRNRNNNGQSSNALRMLLNLATSPATQRLANTATRSLLGRMQGAPPPKKKGRAFQAARATSVPKQEAMAIAPVARNSVRRQGGPRVKNASNNQSIRVHHSERFGTLLNSGVFAVKTFNLQPALGTGLQHMFPWCAGIARQYEMYKIHSVTIHYKTISSTASKGHVLIAPDFDALDDPPTSGIQAESYKSTVSGPVWQNLSCRLDPADLARRSPKYCRSTSAPAASDLKTYDTANIYVCVEAGLDTAEIGYLYVDYDIEFFTPARPATLESNSIRCAYFGFGGDWTLFTALPGCNMFKYTNINTKKNRIAFAETGYYTVTTTFFTPLDPVFLAPNATTTVSILETTAMSSLGHWGQHILVHVTVGDHNNRPYVEINTGNFVLGYSQGILCQPAPGVDLHGGAAKLPVSPYADCEAFAIVDC